MIRCFRRREFLKKSLGAAVLAAGVSTVPGALLVCPWRSDVRAAEASASARPPTDPMACYVRVSPRDPRYLELSNGAPYIPNGLNMIHPGGDVPAARGLAEMDRWMKALAENGGNYIRVWLSSGFWDMERQQAGVLDEERAKRVDALLALAKKHGIRVKMTIEHFREIDPTDVRQAWASKPLHHVSRGGTAKTMSDWLAGETSRAQFRRKLAWLQKRFGDQPAIFGWELWNEINAVRGGDYLDWSEAMLPELKRLFPKNLTLQSLGSFDSKWAYEPYRRLCRMRDNDIAQVHRYLDLGASLEVCHGPVDVLASDAVRELRRYAPGRPVILAESGAVEPRHTGPFMLYSKDKAGIILHDILFAPFFAGAAGAGQCWHWGEYVDRNNLWKHFRGFGDTVAGIDPPAEGFEPLMIPHPRLRIYALKGRRTALVWCRDVENTWQMELQQGRLPEELKNLVISINDVLPSARCAVRIYDPWKGTWTDGAIEAGGVRLPTFSRSIVVRISTK